MIPLAVALLLSFKVRSTDLTKRRRRRPPAW